MKSAVELVKVFEDNKDKFIDLGLDSGTLWGGSDLIIDKDAFLLDLCCPYYEHVRKSGYQLPSFEQFDELFNLCSCKLYNKGNTNFVIIRSRKNNNFLRFCINRPFLVRDTIMGSNRVPDYINILSRYFNITNSTRSSSGIFFVTFLTYDLIFVKDK